MPHVRHFTATGFVVHEGQVALHWHPKVQEWLPPGGHIEANEDPVQAVLREIQEECGVEAEVVGTAPVFGLDYPTQVLPPVTIMVEDIQDPVDGYHQHIDMIYFCRPIRLPPTLNDGWRWASSSQIASGVALERPDGERVPPPDDVRILAEHAFDMVAKTNGP